MPTDLASELRTKQWSIDISFAPRVTDFLAVMPGKEVISFVGMPWPSMGRWSAVLRVSSVPSIVDSPERFQKLCRVC